MKLNIRKILYGLAILAAIGGTGEFLIHHYDPTRVLYKRLKAADRYVYDEIHPRFREIDPASRITIATPADAAAARTRLIGAIWGGAALPVRIQPARIETGYTDAKLPSLPNLAQIDRLTVDLGNNIFSYLYHFLPAERARNRTVIYHHGYAGSFQEVPETIGAFLEQGYAVLGINQMSYGGNSGHYLAANGESYNLHFDLDRIENPLRYHFEPVIVGVNYLLRDDTGHTVDMVGFSAGAFVATVAAAIDDRIRSSYPVAGVYPIYLREGQDIQQGMPSYYPPLLAAAGYLDMFVLGAAGSGRRQMQLFNRYDRCCYNNTKAQLYAPAVSERAAALDGAFRVLIDETHADHRFSRFARDAVLADLARRSGR